MNKNFHLEINKPGSSRERCRRVNFAKQHNLKAEIVFCSQNANEWQIMICTLAVDAFCGVFCSAIKLKPNHVTASNHWESLNPVVCFVLTTVIHYSLLLN